MNQENEISSSSSSSSSDGNDSGCEIPNEGMMDYYGEIDRILNYYEEMAQNESTYLLETTHHLPNRVGMVIKTGLSPARTFGASVVLSDTRKVPNISVNFGYFQWATFIHQLKYKCNTFFEQPLEQDMDNYDPIPYKCDDYITITQMVWDDTKFLCVERYSKCIYLEEVDVRDILHFDEMINSHRMLFLEKMEFAVYYHNLIDLVQEMVLKNANLNAIDLLQDFCNVSNSIESICLREHLFYYKNNVITLLNNKIN